MRHDSMNSVKIHDLLMTKVQIETDDEFGLS